MKRVVTEYLRALYPDATAVEMEVPIRETGQRADVLATLDDGTRIAVEIQIHPMTIEMWEKRHALYQSAGVNDIWLIGHGQFKDYKPKPLPAFTFDPLFPASEIDHKRGFQTLETAIASATMRIYYLKFREETLKRGQHWARGW